MTYDEIVEKCAELADAYADGQNKTVKASCVAKAIRALKSSLPAETVSEAMVEDLVQTAIEAFDNVYDAEFRTTGIIDNKPVAMRAALEAAALAHTDDGWRLIDDNTPRGGTRLWLYWPSVEEDGRQTVGWWREGIHGGYWCDHADTERENPTYWRPLPAPPKDGRE